MTFLEKLNQINQLLDKIKTINTNVSRSTGISILESDLIKQHLRSLYELYAELEHLKNDKPTETSRSQAQEKETKVIPEVEVKSEVVAKKNPPTIESVTEKIEATVQKAKEEVKVEAPKIEEVIPKVEAVSTKVEVEKIPEIKKEESKTVEVEEEEGMSLFEKYQKKTPQKDLNIKTNKIKSIKQLISVNDKFIIIKELFGNAISKYEKMIQDIDKFEHKSEALSYMKSEVWNTDELKEKEDVIERVQNILDRKFVGE